MAGPLLPPDEDEFLDTGLDESEIQAAMAAEVEGLDLEVGLADDEAKSRPKLTETDLRYIVNSEMEDAWSFASGRLLRERKKALEYYFRRPFGDEREGRSSVQLSEVADTIEWILPALLRIFTSGPDTVQIEPTEPEDDEYAEQATDASNHVFNKENNGFLVMYVWFKDALLQKNGTVKIYPERSDGKKRETYEGLSDEQLAELLADPEVEPIEYTETEAQFPILDPTGVPVPGPDGQPQYEPRPMHAVTVHRTQDKVTTRIENVAPEDFRVARDTKEIESARFVQHLYERTESELIAEGPPARFQEEPEEGYLPEMDPEERAARWEKHRAVLWEEKVHSLPDDYSREFDEERLARETVDDEPSFSTDYGQQKNRVLHLSECYIRADMDGDGLSELLKVTVVGDNRGEILEWEPTDSIPFFTLTPIIVPHRFYGWSVADLTMDLQRIMSVILRQFLDNLYIANNTRYEVVEDKVNMADLLSSTPGGAVRVEDEVGRYVREMTPNIVAPFAIPGLEFMKQVKENRTGVTAYNQGIDSDSLNKTAHGMQQIMNAAAQRVELIARVFAETGVRKAFQYIVELLAKHQNRKKMIRLRNQWIEVDPSAWQNKMDVTINVGLGTGNREQVAGNLREILELQARAMAEGGAGVLVTPEHIYNTASRLIENVGFKATDKFIQDPSKAEPPPPEPPSVEEREVAIKEQQAQHEAQLDSAKLKLEAQEIQLKDQREREKIQLEHERELMLLQIRAAEADAKLAAAQRPAA